MTDHRSPDLPDDDVPTDAFDGLDLDALTTGVHATADQWSSIATAASHRRHRRAWVVAAAAMVVLVVATAAVVLNREGTTDQVDVASGGLGDATEEQFVIPPADATIVQIGVEGTSYAVQYTDPDGRTTLITSEALADLAPGQEVTAAGIIESITTNVGGQELRVDPVGTVYLSCASATASGSPPDTVVRSFRGPVSANLISDHRLVQVTRVLVPSDPPEYTACVPPLTDQDPIVARLRELRVADAAGWRAFLAEHQAETTPHSTVDTGVDPIAPSTTTSIDTAPAEQGTADQQIGAAVAGLMDRDADGGYPNLEDGISRAGEYEDMFDLAATQSGADQVADPQEGPFVLANTTFTAPDRATITFDAAAHLPSGDYHFAVPGTALLQDGRWVISYDTIATMVGRACTPPGGVSTACAPRG